MIDQQLVMGDAIIKEFNQSFAKEQAEIEALRVEVASKMKQVTGKNSEIAVQRKQAENYRSDINTLLARVQANEVLRDNNRKRIDGEISLLEAQQDELNEKKEYLKGLFDLERKREENFIKTISEMNSDQLACRKKVLAPLGVANLGG